ncbi:MAG: hypothetical protein DMF78_17715 [Acidobacteria bacterium]|nr:MAG: hypothetical protein DMF78_17715 [Acidobacteriota bacterium]
MAGPRLTVVALQGGDVSALLEGLPAAPGVAQVLGPDGKSLLIARPANIRRWAAAQLGKGKPSKKGARPPTNLAPITSAVAYAATTSPFAQRLAYERVMARHVPMEKRRDLKPPVYLHLDPAARFPRLTVRPAAADRDHLFGPFRSRQAAQDAIGALHRVFPLRPCDFAFEPAVDLALGLGCVFAQVRTCAAPCLVRIAEDDYRALAARAAETLAARERPPELAQAIPPWVDRVTGARGLVVESGRGGLEMYPVVEGAVVEEAMAVTPSDAVEQAVAALVWPSPSTAGHDAAWLSAWLHGKRTGRYFRVGATERAADIAARLRG